jgi:Antibiotic biosynthesis monooxygenase
MIMTVLEAQVPPDRASSLLDAYTSAGEKPLPPGLVRTELLHDARDAARWRIPTWWTSREALEVMRAAGTPAGILMFRAAGAEPTVGVFDVVDALPRAPA